MSHIVLVGLNHRTAKLDVRQLASLNDEQLPEGLAALSARAGILESMIVSTCNRVEILSAVGRPSEGIDSIESFLSEYSRVSRALLAPRLYRYTDDQAVRHIFRVASSLDSMVLGEPQILGQVKSCYNAAVQAGTVGTHLNSLLQAAFRTAKRVRSETSIGEYSVSVGSAAIELVRKIFGDLQKKSILVVGAGKMGEAALRHLSETGSKNVYLTSRRPETALELARRFHGMAVPFADLRAWAARADVVFTSTGSTEILIDPAMVQGIMHLRKNAPIAFIDISVPRNVDPRIGSMENVFFYDIDDLQAVVEANLGERVKAAAAAEKIVDQEVEAFCVKLRSFDVAPVVAQVQNRIDEICRGELERSLRRLGPPDPRQLEELQSMIARIAHKIAHPLIAQLRNARDSADQEAYHELIRKIFKLQKDGD